MTSAPSISIVMPLWNKEREVSRAISSVLSQCVRDWELLVVNDGSTDGSRRAAATFHDSRIHIIDQPNSGVSAARNTGISRAAAQYIAFLDADDEWLPDFLDRILALAARYPEAAVFATGVARESAGVRRRVRVLGVETNHCGLVPTYFDTTGLLTASSVVVRQAAFRAAGVFPLGVPFGEDLDTWLRLAARFPVAFDSHPAAILHCDASNRASHRTLPSPLAALIVSLGRLADAPEVDADVMIAASRYVAGVGLADIQRRLALGQADAARHLARSWRQHFEPTTLYCLLLLATMCPGWVLRLLGRAASRFKSQLDRPRRCGA